MLFSGFYLPYWCWYIAWILCTAISVTCITITVMYGYRFGVVKSVLWLQSLYFSFMICVFIFNPLLVSMVHTCSVGVLEWQHHVLINNTYFNSLLLISKAYSYTVKSHHNGFPKNWMKWWDIRTLVSCMELTVTLSFSFPTFKFLKIVYDWPVRFLTILVYDFCAIVSSSVVCILHKGIIWSVLCGYEDQLNMFFLIFWAKVHL